MCSAFLILLFGHESTHDSSRVSFLFQFFNAYLNLVTYKEALNLTHTLSFLLFLMSK